MKKVFILAVALFAHLLVWAQQADDYREAASRGDAQAQFNLGNCYNTGLKPNTIWVRVIMLVKAWLKTISERYIGGKELPRMVLPKRNIIWVIAMKTERAWNKTTNKPSIGIQKPRIKAWQRPSLT